MSIEAVGSAISTGVAVAPSVGVGAGLGSVGAEFAASSFSGFSGNLIGEVGPTAVTDTFQPTLQPVTTAMEGFVRMDGDIAPASIPEVHVLSPLETTTYVGRYGFSVPTAEIAQTVEQKATEIVEQHPQMPNSDYGSRERVLEIAKQAGLEDLPIVQEVQRQQQEAQDIQQDSKPEVDAVEDKTDPKQDEEKDTQKQDEMGEQKNKEELERQKQEEEERKRREEEMHRQQEIGIVEQRELTGPRANLLFVAAMQTRRLSSQGEMEVDMRQAAGTFESVAQDVLASELAVVLGKKDGSVKAMAQEAAQIGTITAEGLPEIAQSLANNHPGARRGLITATTPPAPKKVIDEVLST